MTETRGNVPQGGATPSSTCRCVPAGASTPSGGTIPVNPNSRASQRVRAASLLMLDRDDVLLAVASRLGSGEVVFESSIRGSSMWPAIPGRARLRVRRLVEQRCKPGDIVFYLADTGFVVHRIAYQPRRGPGIDYVIAFGDNCLTPDQPIRHDRILGIVIAFRTAGGWRPPDPAKVRTIYHRLARAAALGAMIATVRFNVAATRRLALVLSALESVGRAPVGRLLRRLHLQSTGR